MHRLLYLLVKSNIRTLVKCEIETVVRPLLNPSLGSSAGYHFDANGLPGVRPSAAPSVCSSGGVKSGTLNFCRSCSSAKLHQTLPIDSNVVNKDVQIQERWRRESKTVRNSVCYNCNEEGHFSRECPHPKSCYVCGEKGHISHECKSKKASEDSRTCYVCGSLGHFSRECPKAAAPDNRKCYRCGKTGHISRNCPNM